MISLKDCQYAEPLFVSSATDECYFYHTMELPELLSSAGSTTVQGSWDLRGRFSDYIGGVDVKGKSLLDVGVATGWLSFEAERHGAAEVVGVELPPTDQPQHVPLVPKPDEPDRFARAIMTHDKIRRSYWLCHRLYRSAAKLVYCNVHKLGEHARGADITIVGQILVHQRDPLHALWQCAQATEDILVIVEGAFDHPEPIMRFLGHEGARYAWFHLSHSLYRDYLKILGFEVQSITRNSYLCAHHSPPVTEVHTIVAKRVGPTLGRQ